MHPNRMDRARDSSGTTDTGSVLIADICRSTRLYEDLGDAAASGLVSQCLERLAEAASIHQGRVVKTMGDSVLCLFREAEPSLDAAAAMQAGTGIDGEPIGSAPLRLSVRIAVHTGPVLRRGKDIFGDTVNAATRLADLAKPGQILISDEALERSRHRSERQVRSIGTFHVKGRRHPLTVHELIWNLEELTYVNPELEPTERGRPQLKLLFRDRVIWLDDSERGFSLGRHAENDLVVDHPPVSRFHARVEFRAGNFFLVDRSTNGTHLTTERGETLFLHLEEATLQGAGWFSLGLAAAPNTEWAIRYERAGSGEEAKQKR